MPKFAFINDNKIIEKREAESIDSFYDKHLFQHVIDITDMSYEPQVGWVFENGILKLKCPEVTPRQIKQALVIFGVPLSTIDNALNSMPEPNKTFANIEWHESNAFNRDRPLVKAVGQMLGWTEKQLDDLWMYASKL